MYYTFFHLFYIAWYRPFCKSDSTPLYAALHPIEDITLVAHLISRVPSLTASRALWESDIASNIDHFWIGINNGNPVESGRNAADPMGESSAVSATF